MKKSSIVLTIVAFALVISALVGVIAFAFNKAGKEGEGFLSNVGGYDVDTENEIWSLHEGDFNLYVKSHTDSSSGKYDLHFYNFSISGLEPGTYDMTWIIDPMFVETGARFINVSSLETGAAGYGFIHSSDINANPYDETYSLTFYHEKMEDLLKSRYRFEVGEKGEVCIYLFAYDGPNVGDLEYAKAIRDLLVSEYLEYVVLSKVS